MKPHFLILAVLCGWSPSLSQAVGVSQSSWSNGSITVICASVDSGYQSTDTAHFTIKVVNESGKRVFVSSEFDAPKVIYDYCPCRTQICHIDLAFEWWYGSDPLLTGVGPQLCAIDDSVMTTVIVPLGRFPEIKRGSSLLVEVWFCYLSDLEGFEYLLSHDLESRRRFDNKEYSEFSRRLQYAQLNPIQFNRR